MPKAEIDYCSFCGKDQTEVLKLIAGPSVFICEECVELCINVLFEEAAEKSMEFKNQPHIESLIRGAQGKEN